MSDIGAVLPNGYGTPLAWVFYESDDDNHVVVRMLDDVPIARYITDFNYTYDEEGDDICDIKLHIPSVEILNLPYLRNDIRLVVQWGFLVNGGEFIKSPKRKIAIRDIETDYTVEGIRLTLKCTDLVSYIKNQKTTRLKTYQNPNAKIAIDAVGRQEDNFLDWLREIAGGQFIPTITYKDSSIRWDINGTMRAAKYDEKNHRFTRARDNARIEKRLYQEFHVAKIIKGKSKALHNAIEDQLKFFSAIGGQGGPFLQNTTDNGMHIHQRNFKQAIFKSFTYKGGTGELLSFRSTSNTRKIKEDKVSSSGINPFTKETEAQEILLAVTDKTKKDNNSGQPTAVTNGPSKEALDQWAEDARTVFKNNIAIPENQQEVSDLVYLKTNYNLDSLPTGLRGDYLNNSIPQQFVFMQSSEVLNTPEYQDILKENSDGVTAKFRKDQVLLGYMLERIQRKFEATARVVGDPSLIKSRIYNFNNLSSLDRGEWYATKVKHSISKSGYFCTLSLLKKPTTIGVSSNSMKKTKDGIIESSDSLDKVYEDDKSQDNYDGVDDISDVYISKYDPNNPDVYTENGLDTLNFYQRLDNIDAEEDYTLGKQSLITPLPKKDYDKTKKPNTDEF